MDAALTPRTTATGLRWLVVDVHHQEITLIGGGVTVLFGVATLTPDNNMIVRDPDGREIAAPAGRVDPQALSKLLLRKLWRRGKWWT